MKASGHSERFRLEVIKSGLEGFERMTKVEEEGRRPVNRPRTWEPDLRQKQKHLKGRNWFRNGGHHVPLFVPHTPGSQLAKMVRAKEEENNQGRKICFLICEVGGTKLHNLNWTPNPWCGEKRGVTVGAQDAHIPSIVMNALFNTNKTTTFPTASKLR